MSGHLKKFKYYCDTERVWVNEDSNTVPTACKNNAEHVIKAGSMHRPSPGYCEVVSITGVESLAGACDLSDINLVNIVAKVNLLAQRVKLLEECAILKGLMVEKS